MKHLVLGILLMSGFAVLAKPTETVEFNAADGLTITADWYAEGVAADAPVIILCHQAGYSRGEYNETAEWLNDLGFQCLAIDQRSGGEVNGVVNETAERAAAKKQPVGYLDAEQDIEAAIDYVNTEHAGCKIILLGSSYSASLVLKAAKEDERVDAVVAFSPGEYFGKELNLKTSISGLNKPTYITSSKAEFARLPEFTEGITGPHLVMFQPKGDGYHGSKALWTENAGYEEYRNSFKAFLLSIQ